MKLYSPVLLIALSLTLSAGAVEIAIGDSAAQVRAVMGFPRGQVHVGGHDLLYFDRGAVELNDGLVSRVGLSSPEEQSAFESKQLAEASRADQERNRMMEEGRALMASKVADSVFQATPYSYQVSFWQSFSRRYPDVPSTDQLIIARSRLAEQAAQAATARAQAEQAQRMADLAERAAKADAVTRDNYNYPFYPDYRDYSYRDNDRRGHRGTDGNEHNRDDNRYLRRTDSPARIGDHNLVALNANPTLGPSRLGWDPSVNMMDWDPTNPAAGDFGSPRR